jgi:hypothetical protein
VIDTTASRYHAARQNDGKGWMLLRLDRIGSARATVIATNLTEADARTKLDEYRYVEEIDRRSQAS